MTIKNRMKSFLYQLPKPIIKSFYVIYNQLKYPDMVEQKMSYGSMNGDKVFYVIRPRTDGIEGLMALFLNAVKQINYAIKKGYIPVIDFENYKTQYCDENKKNKNVWEYYFEQISDYSLSEVYQSKKVILSGLSALSKCDSYLDQRMDADSLKKSRYFIKTYIKPSKDTNEFIEKQVSTINPEKTLGLYLRGTDYTKLKPAGHPVQPDVQQAIVKADEVMQRNGLEYVFLVTEDADIYKSIKEYYKERLIIVTYDKFISNYKGKSFLSQDYDVITQLSDSPYQRGMNYLAKIILLSKCKCFVGGNTCGSWAANVFSDGYIESYIFNLGLY